MEPMFGGNTDPTPYMTAAYALGAFGLLGFAAWNAMVRSRLRALLIAVKHSPEDRTRG